MSFSTNERVIYQPLHPSVRPLLDPEYIDFHDNFVQYVKPDDLSPWDGSARTRVNWPHAGSDLIQVGSVRDIQLSNCQIRVFSPEGLPPPGGWPIFLWLHGGGWAGGNIDSDNDLLTRVCDFAKCVVANIDYRLAPEHPFPAAIEDAVEVLEWVHGPAGVEQLGVNPEKIVIGGASSGGNLAAILSMKAALLESPIHILKQYLVVPVIDNTATPSAPTWAARLHAPWLTPARMLWYRQLYLPNVNDAEKWDASPHRASSELLARSPPTWMALAEQDLLYVEASHFADKLRAAGVSVDSIIYPGMVHAMLALNGVLGKGKKCMEAIMDDVRQTFTRS